MRYLETQLLTINRQCTPVSSEYIPPHFCYITRNGDGCCIAVVKCIVANGCNLICCPIIIDSRWDGYVSTIIGCIVIIGFRLIIIFIVISTGNTSLILGINKRLVGYSHRFVCAGSDVVVNAIVLKVVIIVCIGICPNACQ